MERRCCTSILKPLHFTAQIYGFIFFPMALLPNTGQGFLVHKVTSHITTHHSQWDSSGRVISPTQRPLPDNTQHWQQTDIQATGGTRTRNSSARRHTPYTARPMGPANTKLKMSNACVRNRPLYGSHPLMLITNKPHLYRRTQHRFTLIAPYVYATCFGPFSRPSSGMPIQKSYK